MYHITSSWRRSELTMLNGLFWVHEPGLFLLRQCGPLEIFWGIKTYSQRGRLECISMARGFDLVPFTYLDSAWFFDPWLKWWNGFLSVMPVVQQSYEARRCLAIQPLCLVTRRSCLFAAVFLLALNVHLTYMANRNNMSSAQEYSNEGYVALMLVVAVYGACHE